MRISFCHCRSKLYPDEWDDLNQYTNLTEPVYFGPRFLNLNVTEVPAT
jgi:hypothetical protein